MHTGAEFISINETISKLWSLPYQVMIRWVFHAKKWSIELFKVHKPNGSKMIRSVSLFHHTGDERDFLILKVIISRSVTQRTWEIEANLNDSLLASSIMVKKGVSKRTPSLLWGAKYHKLSIAPWRLLELPTSRQNVFISVSTKQTFALIT